MVNWCAPSSFRERLRAACGAVNPGSYDINIERVTCKKCKLVGSHGQEERPSISKEPRGVMSLSPVCILAHSARQL